MAALEPLICMCGRRIENLDDLVGYAHTIHLEALDNLGSPPVAGAMHSFACQACSFEWCILIVGEAVTVRPYSSDLRALIENRGARAIAS